MASSGKFIKGESSTGETTTGKTTRDESTGVESKKKNLYVLPPPVPSDINDPDFNYVYEPTKTEYLDFIEQIIYYGALDRNKSAVKVANWALEHCKLDDDLYAHIVDRITSWCHIIRRIAKKHGMKRAIQWMRDEEEDTITCSSY